MSLTSTIVTAAGYEDGGGAWVTVAVQEGPWIGTFYALAWDRLNAANVCAAWGVGVRTLHDLIGREWKMMITPDRTGRKAYILPAYPQNGGGLDTPPIERLL